MKNLLLILTAYASVASAQSSTLVCFQAINSSDLFSAPTIKYQVYDTATKNLVTDLTLNRMDEDPGEFGQTSVSYGIGGQDLLDAIYDFNEKTKVEDISHLETQVPTVNLIPNAKESQTRKAQCFNLMPQ